MSSISIQGSTFTVRGTVVDQATQQGVVDVVVSAYDKDTNLLLDKDDYLGIGVTDEHGKFEIRFEASAFRSNFLDRYPDLYFTVLDGGIELANTEDKYIKSAGPDTPEITLSVDLSKDKLRKLINPTAVPGWVGGFAQSNEAFAYPTPNLSSLPMLGNLDNIGKLQRQQKVVWPEFSWNSEPDAEDKKRCYQMFAPDISRLGYTAEGRVYSIICPQQGACSPNLGSINVEVTVTGNRGWANESDRTLFADMTVQGCIWFSPSAHQGPLVKKLWDHFKENKLPFPSTKANGIIVRTYMPGNPDQPSFPLIKGQTDRFPIPAFAQHNALAWTVGHLDVEIGAIKLTGVSKVDEFNQAILDIFNLAAANMLKEHNVLSWNVWFTAPEDVNQEEWSKHAEYWRTSIDTDHGSPDGDSSPARYYDGSPLRILQTIVEEKEATSSPFKKIETVVEKKLQTMLEKKEETIAEKEEAIIKAWMRKHM